MVKYGFLLIINMAKSTPQAKQEYIDGVLRDLSTESIRFRGNFPHQEDIRNLYQRREITDQQIESALERAVMAQARKDFNYLTNPKAPVRRYPDHLSGTEAMLAHGIEHGVFTGAELDQIPFDHGGIMSYGREFFDPGLIIKLKAELLGTSEESDS